MCTLRSTLGTGRGPLQHPGRTNEHFSVFSVFSVVQIQEHLKTNESPFPSSATLRTALARYDEVVAAQGVAKLAELDRWYHRELPDAIAARRRPHVTLTELVRLAEWKMSRGVWRAPNLVLVRSNAPAVVQDVSAAALELMPHPTKPIAMLAKELKSLTRWSSGSAEAETT